MMSKKQLACMLALHIVYLLVGASIFYHIESPLELQQRAEDKLERLEIQSKSLLTSISIHMAGNATSDCFINQASIDCADFIFHCNFKIGSITKRYVTL